MRRCVAAFVAGIAAAASSGCDGRAFIHRAGHLARDLLPRTHTVSTAPDGRTQAFVRQHLNPDPPDDHLYIVPPGRSPRHVMALAPDQDWSRTIVWSPDSRKVAFVINDQRLALFGTSTCELEAMLLLVADESQEARAVTLTSDHVLAFDLVERAVVDVPVRGGRVVQMHAVQISQFRPGSRVAKPARVVGRRTMRIPPARLRLRVHTPEGHPVAIQGWARMQTRDGRQVRTAFSSASDGLVLLPSFEPGPFSIVEVGRSRSPHTAVLRDVVIRDTPLNVTLPAQ